MTVRGFFLLAILSGSLAAADNPELTGRVVDAQSGEPIARAHVTVHFFQNAQQGMELTLLSDTDGSFRITNLPAGQYQVNCEKTGYLPGSQGAVAGPVGGNAKPAPMVIRLTAQAAIEGTVVDDQGAPVPNANIQLVRQQVMNGKRQFQMAQGGATDESGYFRIFGLPAGRYYIAVAARVSGRRAKSMAYPSVFYPNSTEIAAAQPFDLKAGDEMQIPIKLPEPVPAREIRGTVAPAAQNVFLRLNRQPANSPLPANVDTNWDAKAGTFRISRVTPGMYLLTAGVQDGQNWRQANTVVTVGNADVTGIRLEPAETGLDGTLRAEGSAAPPPRIGGGIVRSDGVRLAVGVSLGSVSFQSERAGFGAPVDADGKFHVANLPPDTYRATVQLFGQQCIQSIQQGGRDAREGVVVAAEVAPAPVDIVLTSHCGSVEAALALSDSSQPPSNLTAVLLRRAGEELALEKQAFAIGRMGDTAPRFRFQGVTPGNYTLYVWPQDAQIEYANPEYMRQFESYGQEVTVTEDAQASVTIDKVLPGAGKN
jgi:hypothetical protein